jgi:hypothetical protein
MWMNRFRNAIVRTPEDPAIVAKAANAPWHLYSPGITSVHIGSEDSAGRIKG